MIKNQNKRFYASDLRLLRLGLSGLKTSLRNYVEFLEDFILDESLSYETQSKVRTVLTQANILLFDAINELDWAILEEEEKKNDCETKKDGKSEDSRDEAGTEESGTEEESSLQERVD